MAPAPAIVSPAFTLLAVMAWRHTTMHLRNKLLYAFLLAVWITWPQQASAQEQCYGPYLQIAVTVPGQSLKPSFGALASFGANLSAVPTSGLALTIADPPEACGGLKPVTGGALLVRRGNCSFIDKALNAKAAGAAAVLMYNHQPGCISASKAPNVTFADDAFAFVSISQDFGMQLLDLEAKHGSGSVTLSLSPLVLPLIDPSAFVLWFVAVGTVLLGSLWSGADHQAARRSGQDEQGGSHESRPKDHEVMDITPRMAWGAAFVASAALLLMFFFLSKFFFFIIIAIFSFSAVQAMTMIFMTLAEPLLPSMRKQHVEVPWLGPCPLLGVLCVAPALALTIVWVVFRNAGWSWVLQDLQGVALMLMFMRVVRLPNLKVACILLPCLFAYDVFWVFIQPMLIGGGESVMVEVAEGAGSGEFMPMVLRLPRFAAPFPQYSMLGFGDIILPGLLVAYTRRVDLDHKTPLVSGYWLYTTAAYGAGLVLTYVALVFSWFGDQGQPALLYLVPATLGTVIAIALARGELGSLMQGGKRQHGYARLEHHHHGSGAGDGAAEREAEDAEAGRAVGVGSAHRLRSADPDTNGLLRSRSQDG